MRRRAEKMAEQVVQVGGFRADGSFNEHGDWRDPGYVNGHVYRLVHQLRDRRIGTAEAEREAVSLKIAYGTSAYEAIRRQGYGIDGHWCRGYWERGMEAQCASDHRGVPSPEAVAEVMRQAMAALGQSTQGGMA